MIPSTPFFAALVGVSYWTRFYTFVENNVNSQTRMIQIIFIGMCIALYIIIWKKK